MGSNPGDHQPLTLQEVISGLRPLLVWMSNSLELLQFIQFQLPIILEWRLGKEQRGRDSIEVENLGNDLKVFYMNSSQSRKVVAVRMFTVDQLMCDLCDCQLCWSYTYPVFVQPVRRRWLPWRKSSCWPSSSVSTTSQR